VNEQSQPDEGRPIYPIKLTVWAEEDDRKTELIHKLRLLLVEYGANYRLKENCLRESRVYENRCVSRSIDSLISGVLLSLRNSKAAALPMSP
jgi:hypothetical protein